MRTKIKEKMREKMREKITDKMKTAASIIFIFCLLPMGFISCGKGGRGSGLPLGNDQINRNQNLGGGSKVVKSGVSEAQSSMSRTSIRLDSTAVGGMVSKLDVIVYDIGNVNPWAYNGTARFDGRITFARVYSASQTLHQSPRSQTPTQFACPSVGVPYPFSCQARFSNGFFTCEQARIHTGHYEIRGHVVKSNQLDHSASVIDLEVIGPCAHTEVNQLGFQNPYGFY